MTIGFSTEFSWLPLTELEEREGDGIGTLCFNENNFKLESHEAIWVVLEVQKALQYLTFTIGSITEEYLFRIDLTGATPVLQHEDGRVLYIRKKGGVNHVERTNQRAAGKDTQAV